MPYSSIQTVDSQRFDSRVSVFFNHVYSAECVNSYFIHTELAESLVSQYQSATQTNAGNASDMRSFNVDNIQRNVLYTEVMNGPQLLAAVHLLPATLADNPNVYKFITSSLD